MRAALLHARLFMALMVRAAAENQGIFSAAHRIECAELRAAIAEIE